MPLAVERAGTDLLQADEYLARVGVRSITEQAKEQLRTGLAFSLTSILSRLLPPPRPLPVRLHQPFHSLPNERRKLHYPEPPGNVTLHPLTNRTGFAQFLPDPGLFRIKSRKSC